MPTSALTSQFRDHEVAIGPGELIVVPHQVEHRPVADAEVDVPLLEPKSAVNTGTAGGDRTRQAEWIERGSARDAHECGRSCDHRKIAAAQGGRARRSDSGRTDGEGGAMAVRVVRLGTPRRPGEGLRVGTVRRPPRGVPKAEYRSRDFYDVWLPELSPSEALVKQAQAATDEREWRSFARRYRAEMKRPEAARLLDLLAALSRQTNLSVGCYCEDETRCHRSVLQELLSEHGANVA